MAHFVYFSTNKIYFQEKYRRSLKILHLQKFKHCSQRKEKTRKSKVGKIYVATFSLFILSFFRHFPIKCDFLRRPEQGRKWKKKLVQIRWGGKAFWIKFLIQISRFFQKVVICLVNVERVEEQLSHKFE